MAAKYNIISEEYSVNAREHSHRACIVQEQSLERTEVGYPEFVEQTLAAVDCAATGGRGAPPPAVGLSAAATGCEKVTAQAGVSA